MAEPLQKAEATKEEADEQEIATEVGYTVTPEGRVQVNMDVLLDQLGSDEARKQLRDSEAWLQDVLGGKVEFQGS